MANGPATLEDRRLVQRLLLDLLICIVLVIPIIVCEFGIEPYRRGFFCADETIRYPFLPNTVTTLMLGLLAGLVPLLLLLVVEFLRYCRGSNGIIAGGVGATQLLFGWATPTWLVECAKQFAYFAVGLALTFDATEVGKYTIGRLRPHFIAICQPHLLDGSTCADAHNQHRYVESYVCVGEGYAVDDVRQARLSFPSGHSSLAVYAMLYLAVYVQHKVTWRGSQLARHFLQFALMMVAWFTALSRVMDNWHHWSDVVAGSLIGVAGALLTARYIAKMGGGGGAGCTAMGSLKISIPRQDTTTTLQEVMSTPPPYTMDNVDDDERRFSNEQYCTKV